MMNFESMDFESMPAQMPPPVVSIAPLSLMEEPLMVDTLNPPIIPLDPQIVPMKSDIAPTLQDLVPEINHLQVSNGDPSMNVLDVNPNLPLSTPNPYISDGSTSNHPLSNPTEYINSDGITFDAGDYAALSSLLTVNQLEKGLQTDSKLGIDKSTQTVIDANFFVLMDQFFNSSPLSETETHRFHTTATQDGRVHEININLNLNQS